MSRRTRAVRRSAGRRASIGDSARQASASKASASSASDGPGPAPHRRRSIGRRERGNIYLMVFNVLFLFQSFGHLETRFW